MTSAASDAALDDASTVDTGTIGWLLPEIVSAFDAATTALRAFRAGAAGVDRQDVDLAPLRVARSHLHQAHGALEMSEVAGVTRLTGAMEDLLATFEAQPERCDAIALDAVIGGCRAIVEYLEDLQAAAPQQPLHLFASYRDLLVASGVDRIHPADLFLVDPAIRPPRIESSGDLAAIDASALNEQRSAFEQALLRFLRNDRDASAVVDLGRAIVAIDEAVLRTTKPGQAQHRAFWWVTRALFEALSSNGFASGHAHQAHLKRLAGRINLQIRKLAEGSTAVAERLFTDTLFFVAIAAPVTPHVREVQAHYRLEDTVPKDFDTQRYGRVDPAALRKAREALAAAKSAWSAVVAGDVGQIRAFAKETGGLMDAIGPLNRRGLVQVAQVIDGIATDLGFDPRRPPAAVGLDVATALLFLEGALERARSLDDAFDARAALVVARVEASALGQEHPVAVDWLDRMSREAEERLTMSAFVDELQANLRSAEKSLDAFFRDPAGERAGLKDAQKALGQVSGALALLGHEDVHRAIDHACASIERFREDDQLVDQAEFDRLAQNLGAVGFYVEQIKRERIDTDAFEFDPASGRFDADMARVPGQAEVGSDVVAVSGFPPDASAEPATEHPGAAVVESTGFDRAYAATDIGYATTDIGFASTEILEPEATFEDGIARRAADAREHAMRLSAQPDDQDAREQLIAAVDDVRRNAMLIDDRALHDAAAALLKTVRSDHSVDGTAEISDGVAALANRADRAAGVAVPGALPLDPTAPVPSEENVDAIDAELLEIFLEEAAGVLADADASMRVLDADPDNATATVNLRRGFHTLKGSGRMVGLVAFGDAAWSIEETLNDHIADQKPATPDLRALVAYAIRYLGDWADELRATGHSTRIPDALIEAARAVRRTGTSDVDLRFDAPAPPVEAMAEAADEPVLEGGDDFLKTEILAPEPAEDAYFAATQVLDETIVMPDLEFFGVELQTPSSDAVRTRSDAQDAPAEPSHEATDFNALFAIDVVEPEDATSPLEEAAASLPPLVVDEGEIDSFEATAILPFESEPAETEVEPLSADFLLDFGDEAELVAEADPDEAVLQREPLALTDEEADALAKSGIGVLDEAPAEASSGTVLPFKLPQPPTRGDDVRRIGSLTLSVALFNIYLTEADELLRVLTQDFAEWRHELDRYVSEGAMRAAHSLAGSSSTVGLVPAHDLAAGIEDVLQTLWREPVVLRIDQVQRLEDAVESLTRMLHRFAAERLPEPDPVRIAGLLALRREIAGEDPARIGPDAAALADEAVVPPAADAALPFDALDFGDAVSIEAPTHFSPEDVSVAPFEPIDDTPVTVEATAFADDASVEPGVDETAFEVVPTVDGLDEGRVQEVDALTLAPSDDLDPSSALDVSETPVEAGPASSFVPDDPVANPTAADEATETIEPFVEEPVASGGDIEQQSVEHDAAETVSASFYGSEATFDASDSVSSDSAPVVEAPEDVAFSDPLFVAPQRVVVEPVVAINDDIDPELLDIFVEEGSEILPQIGQLLRTWQQHPAEAAPARTLLRHLHTLKGSARMAGAMRLGEVVHDIEARVESAARLHEIPAALFDELLAAHDRSLELFDRLQNPVVEAAPVQDEAVDAASTTIHAESDQTPDLVVEATAPAAQAVPDARTRDVKPSQQAVRVNSETLDRLVNLAGEVSISRARIENEVQQIKGSMADLSENVERLRSQLREIELQAEFQMQSQMQSQQASGQEREKFDPLEFDRFTRFQELTRMMAESVNDVKTLQQHLQKSLDTAETDLASQRRMTRDLQQDLMRVRMVPFSSIAERLYRVARRTAKELDKRVNLDIRGGSVEIDRGVLDRMAGPFEHLLRNHIVHGIESRATRRSVGKDEIGELLVEVRQEGNEIVLTFSDDGAGLDYDRIRAKGRELGLVGQGDFAHEFSDAQAAELIFHPGFSTASEVTELAGRGVGMDVVRAEAMVLAGRVTVDSDAGRGTRFTINLPLTLAVTQVVLVAVTGRVYALPSVLVEQVQQLRPQPLADAYRAGSLTWAGAPVRLAFLGSLLGIDDSVPVAQRASPVLILRSAGERIAIHVDEVVGNQEVVVKNLGPQLSRMTGIAGATVLGSGEIVLILNPVQLAQLAQSRPMAVPVVIAETVEPDAQHVAAGVDMEQRPPAPSGVDLQTLPTVMVVDDSLTVRRVTQRLLSREGYQVVLAKDGVDALEQLQDYPPDVMLVDIEMPRMDGFDLTRNVRNDDRYRHIPIIMITSRTAEKHRRHAADLGVDAYLGKPYQEDELLDLLATYVRTKRSQPA